MKAVIAPVFSFILNGLGQIYNGQIKKGIIFIIISLICLIAIVIASVFLFDILISSFERGFEFSQIIGPLLLLTLAVFFACLNSFLSMLDAYKVAKKDADKDKSNH